MVPGAQAPDIVRSRAARGAASCPAAFRNDVIWQAMTPKPFSELESRSASSARHGRRGPTVLQQPKPGEPEPDDRNRPAPIGRSGPPVEAPGGPLKPPVRGRAP